MLIMKSEAEKEGEKEIRSWKRVSRFVPRLLIVMHEREVVSCVAAVAAAVVSFLSFSCLL